MLAKNENAIKNCFKEIKMLIINSLFIFTNIRFITPFKELLLIKLN